MAIIDMGILTGYNVDEDTLVKVKRTRSFDSLSFFYYVNKFYNYFSDGEKGEQQCCKI